MAHPRPITGKKVFWWLVAFFALISAVNGAFMYVAMDTWPGLSTEDAYQKGLTYNDTLSAASEQQALGWQSRIELVAGNSDLLSVVVTMIDKTGNPLTGLALKGHAVRPVGAPNKTALAFHEVAPGRYEAPFRPSLEGRWYVGLGIAQDEATYRMRHEVMVEK